MKLRVRINGVSYDNFIIQGISGSDEFNETLDSGTLLLTNVPLLDIKPYDDVFIFSDNIQFIGYPLDEQTMHEVKTKKAYYKHLLIDKFIEQEIFLGKDNGEEKLYTYTIDLFSETKKLETIQLPNISITQPLDESKRVTIWEYANRFLNLYSPKYKKNVDEITKQWEYVQKYTLDPNLEEIFNFSYSQDFTPNAPNLRGLLSQLFVTKDMIPYVQDDVIYAMNIGDRELPIFDDTKGEINYITGSLDSGNYALNLKRNYTDALSQENTASSIEYVGFRNSDTPLMTLENMRLELEHPIYKINKITMCYYKKLNAYYFEKDGNKLVKKDISKFFLCEQDITPLVKLNSERNALSQDWDDFSVSLENNTSLEEMAKYKLCTIGYDIGSNHITGWGEKYTYPEVFWDVEKSYIENIVKKLETMRPYGKYSKSDILEIFKKDYEQTIILSEPLPFKSIMYPENMPFLEELIGNITYLMKGMFFKIDYTPFYNGCVTHSKKMDVRNSFVTINDNQSSSLSLLEKDGLAQLEKLNRFGNKGITICARYKNWEDVQDIGTIWKDDIIIYRREFSIFNNVINVTYQGTKDYVLKNYYTSVFARYRTYNLMSYGESIRRNENRKNYLFISKDKYYEDKTDALNIYNEFESDFFSFMVPEEKFEQIDDFKDYKNMNIAFLKYKENDYIIKELITFNSGNSICFNVSMNDNITSRPYIKDFKPEVNLKASDDFTGSVQDFKVLTDNYGNIENMNFIIGHYDYNKDDWINTKIQNYTENSKDLVYNYYSNYLFNLPIVDSKNLNKIENKIFMNNENMYKDNKELIDMTYQFEVINENDNDVLFSTWMSRLSNLLSKNKKFNEELILEKPAKIVSFIQRNSIFIDTRPTGATTNESYKLESIIEIPSTSDIKYPYISDEEARENTNPLGAYKVNTYEFKTNADYFDYYSQIIEDKPKNLSFNRVIGFQPYIHKIEMETIKTYNKEKNTYDVNYYAYAYVNIDYFVMLNGELVTLKWGWDFNSNEISDSAKRTMNRIYKSGTNDDADVLDEKSMFFEIVLAKGECQARDINNNIYKFKGDYDNNETIPSGYDGYFILSNGSLWNNFPLINSTDWDLGLNPPEGEEDVDKGIDNSDFAIAIQQRDEIGEKIIYHKNLFFVKAPKMKRTVIYDEYTQSEWDKLGFEEIENPFETGYDYKHPNESKSRKFFIKVKDNQSSSLDAELAALKAQLYGIPTTEEYSYRCYYKNNSNYSKNDDGNYHFVFGINTKTGENSKYYVSLMNDRELDVYDDNHNIIGKLKNCANQDIISDTWEAIEK